MSTKLYATTLITPEESYLALIEFLLLAKQRLFDLANEHSMSGMQVVTLLLVNKPRQMNGFSRIFNCDPSNITGIIDALEDKKLVTRYEHSDDRRIKMVKLLPKGRRTRAALLNQLTTSDDYLLAKLSGAEVATFVQLVQKITALT